ncbi:MAG: hypothetical protein F4Z14_09735 [Gammaproteobacteria bacterium]|nr:hypothetical protein [Gammaproteobacteria bacterium]
MPKDFEYGSTTPRIAELDSEFPNGSFSFATVLPFWTACSNNEEEAATGFPIPYVWPHQNMSKDKFVPNSWLGISISDRFDDTVTKRIVYYSSEDSKILLFERVKDESECLTEMR